MINLHLKKYLSEFNAKTILDVGPGYSSYGRLVANLTNAEQITFIDIDKNVLNWQKTQCEKYGIRGEYLEIMLNTKELNKINENYDIILCLEVLEHLEEAENILKSLVNKMSLTSKIIISVPTKRSERWLKKINKSYMKDEKNGHVREFNESELKKILEENNLDINVFLATQPHYFLIHTWLFGTRMKVEGSTGDILTKGFRRTILNILFKYGKILFQLPLFKNMGKIISRNYFIIATRNNNGNIY